MAKHLGSALRLSGQVVDQIHPGQLPQPADYLPTPTANIGSNGGSQHPDKRRAGGHSVSIQDVAEHLLPTPVASPSGNSPEVHLRKKPGRKRVTDLSIIVENNLLESGGELLPTPTAALATGGAVTRGGDRSDELLLGGIVQQPDWGKYAPAVERWELALGRPAPHPTEPTGRGGRHRLSPRFVEWMMGLPEGWVDDIDIPRREKLRALGNGVVSQQAAAALEDMLSVFEYADAGLVPNAEVLELFYGDEAA